MFKHVKYLKLVLKLLLKTHYAIKVNRKDNNPLGKITSQGHPGTSPKDVQCMSPYGLLCIVKGCPPPMPWGILIPYPYIGVLRTLKYDILRTFQCNVLGRCPYWPTCNAMGHPQPTSWGLLRKKLLRRPHIV